MIQVAAIFSPTSGRRCTHSGGGGIGEVVSVCIQPEMVSVFSARVSIISSTGAKNTTSMASDITATASARRRNRACTLSIKGQVATTIIIAQTNDNRNGRSTQNDARISITISSTANTERGTSRSITGVGARAGAVDSGRSGTAWSASITTIPFLVRSTACSRQTRPRLSLVAAGRVSTAAERCSGCATARRRREARSLRQVNSSRLTRCRAPLSNDSEGLRPQKSGHRGLNEMIGTTRIPSVGRSRVRCSSWLVAAMLCGAAVGALAQQQPPADTLALAVQA